MVQLEDDETALEEEVVSWLVEAFPNAFAICSTTILEDYSVHCAIL